MTVQIFTLHSEAPFCSLWDVFVFKAKSPAVDGPTISVCHLSAVVWLKAHFENKTVKSVICSHDWLLHQLRLEGAFSTLGLWCNELSLHQWLYSSTWQSILQKWTSRMPRVLQNTAWRGVLALSCAAGNETEQGLEKKMFNVWQAAGVRPRTDSVCVMNKYSDGDRDNQDWILGWVHFRKQSWEEMQVLAWLSVDTKVTVVGFSLLEPEPVAELDLERRESSPVILLTISIMPKGKWIHKQKTGYKD